MLNVCVSRHLRLFQRRNIFDFISKIYFGFSINFTKRIMFRNITSRHDKNITYNTAMLVPRFFYAAEMVVPRILQIAAMMVVLTGSSNILVSVSITVSTVIKPLHWI